MTRHRDGSSGWQTRGLLFWLVLISPQPALRANHPPSRLQVLPSPSAPRSSLKRFFVGSGADIHGLWKMAKNSTAQNSHQVSSIRGSQFSYASLRWQMRFFDVSTAVFHAHAERCLKQDGALPILKKMPYGAQHQLKKSESTSSSKLGRLISTFYLRPHSGLWHFLL